jgi:hypothetical protein
VADFSGRLVWPTGRSYLAPRLRPPDSIEADEAPSRQGQTHREVGTQSHGSGRTT